MIFCGEKWHSQEEINSTHERILTELEFSMLEKDKAIRDLYKKDLDLDSKLRRHEDMINSLTECVTVMKQTNQELKEYHDRNSGYFQTIIDNMVTVNVFTHNTKWLAGILLALGVIWKALEVFL
ncbi:MAG: hypothetical protein A3F67_08085 [Verrucomicrobia bacterium RIFCSPHIGHO2_12_FULL_41_10]|nr:MAG: hypothetical protein A3F67_08085 [Verrucomicrobia bacterium RIFCSPHIGHO2_12_FULL_41_10]